MGTLLLQKAGKGTIVATGGGAAFTWDSEAIANPAFASTIQTFLTQGIGPASADRQVLVFIGQSEGDAFISVTIGGVLATQVVTNTTTTTRTAMYMANVPTGTTATIVITCTALIDFIGIEVGHFTGINATATATGGIEVGFAADPQNITLTNPTGGICVFGGWSILNANVPTWNNLPDNRHQIASATDRSALMGTSTVTGSAARGVSNFNSAGFGGVSACWGP